MQQQQLAGSSPNTYKAPTTQPTSQNTSPYSQQPLTSQQTGTTGTTASTQTTPTAYSANTNNTGIANTQNTGITSSNTSTTAPTTTSSNSYQGGWSVPTVEDETAKLTASDSITMQQAKNEGLRTAASRGLLNSSIAGQAAQQAAIAAAAPMAETNVANQISQQQFAQGVTANTQGQYMKATQDVMYNAQVSINEIEKLEGISAGEKDKMIQNTIDRRDADLKFMKSFYEQMPTWSGNWVNFPTMPSAPGVS